jgi:hypothetical protein
MLHLNIKNKLVTLDGKQSLTLNVANAYFESDRKEKNYSYPLKLKLTPEFKAIIQHANRLDARRAKAQNIKASIFYKNQLLQRGYISNIEGVQVTNDQYACYFKKDAEAVWAKLAKYKIADCLSMLEIPQTVVALYSYTISPQATVGKLYRININGEDFDVYAPVNQQMSVIGGLKNLINVKYPGVASTVNHQGYVSLDITPTKDFTPIIRPLSTSDFIVLYEKSYAKSIQENFVNFILTYTIAPRSDVSFNFVQCPGFYAQKNNKINIGNFFNRVEYQNSNWNVYKNEPSVDEHFENSYIPFYRIKYIFEKIALKIGIDSFDFSVLGDDFDKLLMDNNYALDNVLKEVIQVGNNKDYGFLNAFVSKIDPANHVFDQSCQEFISDFCNTFNLTPFLIANKMQFRRNEDVFNQQAVKIENMQPEYSRAYKDDNGFIVKYTDDVEKINNKGQLDSFTKGEGQNDIALPFSTLPLNSLTTVDMAREGSTTAFGIGKKTIAKRLFFDYQENSNSPFRAANHSTPTMSLLIQGANGLYLKQWQRTAQLRASGYPLSITSYMSLYNLKRFAEMKQTKVIVETEHGTTTAYVKELSAKLNNTNSPFTEVKFELIAG